MAGRIRDEDIALVRERAQIEVVVREYVTLRNAGGGSLKGLCPFHDEKSPSFHVTPSRGFYHCFGCQKGGDVISFIQEIDHLSFAEAVERLADKSGVQLRYEEGGKPVGGSSSRNREQRTRFVEAHRDAAEYFAELLASHADAQVGRAFLGERGFDRLAAEHFGVGFAPREGESLHKHLRGRGYSDTELIGAGLVATSQRGSTYDRFRGRLMWPIRDMFGDVVGFGARRLFDDDRIEAKYLNTPETAIYKKSQVLYGVDLAKKDIARRSQAVVVEGYTDVMACHLAGVTTAVATCGTAFGDEHARILRRLLMDQDEYRGEVVFTFDGDAAGQKAAMRAFEGDQRFVAQTFVAVEPDGLDPCEVRQRKGDEAVRELVARRQPLYRFAIRTMLAEYNLDTAEGRAHALDRTVALVAQIRDTALRDEYARQLAGWVGASDETVVVRRVRALTDDGRRSTHRHRSRSVDPAPGQTAIGVISHGDVDPATLAVEREVVKAALQRPALTGPTYDHLADDAFRSPAYANVHSAIRGAVAAMAAASGSAAVLADADIDAPNDAPIDAPVDAGAAAGMAAQAGGSQWLVPVMDAAADDSVRGLITELAVEPINVSDEALPRYIESMVLRLHEMAVSRRLVTLKASLQRTDPSAEPEKYNRLFADLMALEQQRRSLRERAVGGL